MTTSIRNTAELQTIADRVAEAYDADPSKLWIVDLGPGNTLGKLIGNVDRQVGPVSADVTKTLDEARTALQEATLALTTVRGFVDKDSRVSYELNPALKEATGASRAVRLVADYLQRHPESLLYGKPAEKGN